MSTDRCKYCGIEVRDYNNSIMVPSENGYISLCLHCYNKEISKAAGIEYDDIPLHPVVIKDAHDIEREFHFSLRLMGDQQVLSSYEAKEADSNGYEFSTMGDTEDGIFSLFSKLYARMLKALGRKHIYKDSETDSWQMTEGDIVRGRIDCAEDPYGHSRIPLVVIDGKEFSWKEFGHMLMTYEGFNFKLQIFDQSDEID